MFDIIKCGVAGFKMALMVGAVIGGAMVGACVCGGVADATRAAGSKAKEAWRNRQAAKAPEAQEEAAA